MNTQKTIDTVVKQSYINLINLLKSKDYKYYHIVESEEVWKTFVELNYIKDTKQVF